MTIGLAFSIYLKKDLSMYLSIGEEVFWNETSLYYVLHGASKSPASLSWNFYSWVQTLQCQGSLERLAALKNISYQPMKQTQAEYGTVIQYLRRNRYWNQNLCQEKVGGKSLSESRLDRFHFLDWWLVSTAHVRSLRSFYCNCDEVFDNTRLKHFLIVAQKFYRSKKAHLLEPFQNLLCSSKI